MNKERRKEIDRAAGLLRDCIDKLAEARDIVNACAEGEREFYDNMNDNLKGGTRGEQADSAATLLEEAASALDDFDADAMVATLEEARDGE